MKVRNYLIDNLKGIAIFLVIWGHSIQYLFGKTYDFYSDPVYKFIYSFHMPLFMFISGYLFLNTPRKKRFQDIIKDKYSQLIIPLVCWTFVYVFVFYGKQYFSDLNWRSFIPFFSTFLNLLPHYLWFFFALFLCMVICSTIAIFFRDRQWIFLLSFIFLLFFPDAYGVVYLKFMYPYFIAGYLYKKSWHNHKLLKNAISLLSMFIFPIAVYFWQRDSFIYTTGMSFYELEMTLESKLWIILYRYIVGFTGLVLFINFVKVIPAMTKYTYFSKIGMDTYSIYVFQALLIPLAGKFINVNVGGNVYINTIIIIFLNWVLINCIFWITILILKQKYLHRYLLGAR